MPIVFEQPKPFSGGLYSADAIYRGMPALAGAYESAGRIAMGRQQMMQDQAAQETAARVSVGNANAARMQDDRQFHDQAVYRSREQQADIATRAASQASAQNFQLAEQRERFQLAAWLSQQELSQKEVLQLQQEKRAVAEVMAAPLTDEDKTDLLLQLRTGIDAKTQRMKSMQAQAMAEQRQTQALENKVQTELLNQRLAILKGDYEYVVDPDKLAEVQQTLVDRGEGPQLTGFNPAADAAAVADFQKRVQVEAQKRGLGAKFWKKPDGTVEMAEDDKLRMQKGAKDTAADAEERVRKDTDAIMKSVSDWEAAYSKGNEGKPPSAELRAAHIQEAIKNYKAVQDAVRGMHGGDAKQQTAQVKTQVVGA
jgi:hypothetical protein